MGTILLPLDGSSLATQALPLGVELAVAMGHQLRLMEATGALGTRSTRQAQREIGDYLGDTASVIRGRYGLEAQVAVPVAGAVPAILSEARKPGVFSIVMASAAGIAGRHRSVSVAVLRRASVPVFVIPAGRAPFAPLRRMVVPLDGSDLSYSVLHPVALTAQSLNTELILLLVHPVDDMAIRAGELVVDWMAQSSPKLAAHADRYLSPIRARLREQGIGVRAEFVLGEPATEIVRLAREVDAQMIALATHGRTGLQRQKYGSVTEAVLGRSPVPVMAVSARASRHLAGNLAVPS